jgi:hypothetical protein
VSIADVGIDEQLTRLEDEIRRLKVEYDVFFNGATAKPPTDTRYRVETMIKRLYDARGMTFGQRFRYNSLVSRFNVYKELWRRTLKEKEEGRRERDVGAAAPEGGFVASTVRCIDPEAEPEKVRELYDTFLLARRSCGERVQSLPYERFEQMIKAQVRQIKDRLKCEAIEFTVDVDGGAVRFKARASQ